MRMPSNRWFPWSSSLSARLLVLTLSFVMISEVLIYVPSVARFRLDYLHERVTAAQLAATAASATPVSGLTPEVEQNLLDRAGIQAVVIKRPETRTLLLGTSAETPPTVAKSYDLRDTDRWQQLEDAFVALVSTGRTIRVVDKALEGPGTLVDIVLDEESLRAEMFAYSRRVLGVSLLISAITGALVFLSLNLLFVRPMRRITQSLAAFREAPEKALAAVVSGRSDEIGVAERELQSMQEELRALLKQKQRLADLGTAVSKINHDLRNILATAQLVSDRLSVSGDPEVRRIAPTLVSAIDRAVELCSTTLQFGKAEEPAPRRTGFALRQLVDDVGTALGLGTGAGPRWRNDVPDTLMISADREQLFRALMNLGRNATEAFGDRSDGIIAVAAAYLSSHVTIDISDNGPGVPETARKNLFLPFKGTARSGGTGLGLAIARDLIRGHGGDLTLHRTGASGTTFRLEFPANIHEIRTRIGREQSA